MSDADERRQKRRLDEPQELDNTELDIYNSEDDKGEEEEKASAKRTKKLRKPIVWIDCEMTGLDLERDTIIEIACMITNGTLTQVIEGPDIAIHQSDQVLASMNDWCQEHHARTGLTQRVRESTITMWQAEEQILDFIKGYVDYQKAPLGGNSVSVDKQFLQKYMPRLIDYLHYRIIDVSTVKELCNRWYPKDFMQVPKKKMMHRALEDIRESIAELKFYRKTIFKKKTQKRQPAAPQAQG